MHNNTHTRGQRARAYMQRENHSGHVAPSSLLLPLSSLGLSFLPRLGSHVCTKYVYVREEAVIMSHTHDIIHSINFVVRHA